MKLEFTAHEIGAETDKGVVTAWLRAKGWNEQSLHGLMLMRMTGEHDDEADDDVYLEIPIQRFVATGGITKATLSPTNLRIQLNEQSQRAFGGYGELHIQIMSPPSELAELRDGLRVVFRECAFYSESGFGGKEAQSSGL